MDEDVEYKGVTLSSSGKGALLKDTIEGIITIANISIENH